MKNMQDINKVLESQGNTHNMVEVQANLESRSLTSSPTRSLGPLCLQNWRIGYVRPLIWVIYICMKR
jgi:hypothetical protein